MSGENTKASKIDRILRLLRELTAELKKSFVRQRELESTIGVLTAFCVQVSNDNAQLRKLLGKMLTEKREAQVPTLTTGIGNAPRC